MANSLPLGKLAPEHLADLLERHTFPLPDDGVILYPGVGEDAAVIELGQRWLVAKTDPITFATDEIGWYAVQVNANDVAVAGGVPRWFLSTILLPERGTDKALVDRIMCQIAEACRALGIVPCGGHTEVTYGLDRAIVVGIMLGEVEPGAVVRSGGVEVGDTILLTKGVAIEGTAIIAREKAADLCDRFSPQFLARCQAFLHEPGISVVRDAEACLRSAPVHAMHDPTEGGVATGLWELAIASSVGLAVDGSQIPIYEETRALCELYGLDPLGVIASGALLCAVPGTSVEEVCASLDALGVPGVPIARAVPASQGVTLTTADGVRPLPRYNQDEIARLFA